MAVAYGLIGLAAGWTGGNLQAALQTPWGHVVTNCSQGDIQTVMVAGQFRKRAGKMVGVNMEKMLSERIAARDRIYQRAGEKPGQYKKGYWAWGAAN